MKAFVLSAGLGQRLRPFTNKVAKPALPFLSLPLLAYPLFYLSKLKPKAWIFNLHHQPKTILSALDYLCRLDSNFSKDSLCFSDETSLLMGTGGGIGQARSLLKGCGHFILTNADSLFFLSEENSLAQMFKIHLQEKALVTLLCTSFELCTGSHFIGQRRGVLVSREENRLLGFKEEALGPSQNKRRKSEGVEEPFFYHYTGVQIFSEEIFQFIPPDRPSHVFQDVLFPLLNTEHKLKVFVEKKMRWFETGNKKAYKEALKTCFLNLSKLPSKKKDLFIEKGLLSLLSHYNQSEKDLVKLFSSDGDFDVQKHIKSSKWL